MEGGDYDDGGGAWREGIMMMGVVHGGRGF